MDDTELTRYYYIKPSSQSVDSEALRTLWKSVSSIQFVLPIANPELTGVTRIRPSTS